MSTILVVDPSSSMRQMLSFTLKSADFDVVEAVDGQDAWEKSGSHDFSLVLTDWNMPNMDGLSLTKKLRENPKFRITPILILTTESSDQAKQAARAAGAVGWLEKPFSPTKLIEVIGRVLKEVRSHSVTRVRETPYSAPFYPTRVIEVVAQVIEHGKRAHLFDHHLSKGWFALALKDGDTVLSFAMSPPPNGLATHRRRVEEHILWLRSHDFLTSSAWKEDDGVEGAVAVTGYNFYFGYASALPQAWNEAIAVASAIWLGEFNRNVVDDPRWHLKNNPHINTLLGVAYGTE